MSKIPDGHRLCEGPGTPVGNRQAQGKAQGNAQGKEQGVPGSEPWEHPGEVSGDELEGRDVGVIYTGIQSRGEEALAEIWQCLLQLSRMSVGQVGGEHLEWEIQGRGVFSPEKRRFV